MDFGSHFFDLTRKPRETIEIEIEEAPPIVVGAAAGTATARRTARTGLREVKIPVLGCGGVGKSALTVQFVQGIFVEKYDPTIEDSYRKQTEVDGETVMCDVLDTAGQEEFTAMRDLYLRNADACIVIYSLVSRPSFDDAAAIREQVLRVTGKTTVPMVLVGNKVDLHDRRQVATEEGEALARRWGCPFFETSAKTGVNVGPVFTTLVRLWLSATAGPEKKGKKSGGGGLIGRFFGKGKKEEEGAEKGKEKAKEKVKPKTKTVEAMTTNVVSVSLGQLGSMAGVTEMTGDPRWCKKCGAAMTSRAKVTASGKAWSCEVCGGDNAEDVSEEEIPKSDVCEYIIEQAPTGGEGAEQKSMMIFLIDTSGSMCVTQEVPEIQAEWLRLRSGGGAAGNKFVSRLQCSKAAVDSQIGRLAKQNPERRVVLIAFSSDVTVALGASTGGASEDVVLAGSKLDDFEAMWAAGKALGGAKLEPVSKAKEALSKRVILLEESGSTALGPALAVAVSMCAAAGAGARSEIVVVTDGRSNVGIASLESGTGVEGSAEAEAVRAAAREGFGRIAEAALKSNTTISVIGLENEDTGHGKAGSVGRRDMALDVLSDCAISTHGTTAIVNPLALLRQVRSIHQNPIVATDLRISLFTHPSIEVFDDRFVSISRASSAAVAKGAQGGEGREALGEVEAELRRLKSEAVAAEDFERAQKLKEDLAMVEEAGKGVGKATVTEVISGLRAIDGEKLAKLIKGKGKLAPATTAASTAAEGIVIGNAHQESDVSFELQARETGGATTVGEIAVQVAAWFRKGDGARCVRVMTRRWQSGKSRSAAEESMNVSVVGLHALHRAAGLAQKGEHGRASELLEGATEGLKRAAKTEVQVEERYIFGKETADLARQLLLARGEPSIAASDATAKLVATALTTPRRTLLSGRVKLTDRWVVADESAMEHVSSFGVEASY